MFRIPWFSFQQSSLTLCTLNKNVLSFQIPWSSHVLKNSFLVLSVARFIWFFSLLWLFLPSSLLTFLHFIRSFILLIICFVIHGFRVLLSAFPTKSLTVSNTHFVVLFHSTSTFLLSHSIVPSFYSRVSCTFCPKACNFSKSHLGFPFWKLRIFFFCKQ
jgi:hypothetical protein